MTTVVCFDGIGDTRVRGGGYGEEGGYNVTMGGEREKTGSGLHKVIISDILASLNE